MDKLLACIEKFQPLDSETILAVRDHFIMETYPKNATILEAGQVCTKVFYIESGFVRRFYIHDGTDRTIWFYGSNQMATSMPSFFQQNPSYEYLQTCEKTIIYSLFREDEGTP
ncbi:MAG: cyclic nucleotide-binding domain-containing protein [Bacteroidales bacterium]|nr:cyclic nucleotide-binding domain-containing protein [Bacteroidales bacterium]